MRPVRSARSAARFVIYGVRMTPSARSRRTRIAVAGAALLVLGIPLAALAAGRGGSSPAAGDAAPSFTRDVAPIVREKCTGCHRVGGIAPFPLETARQISSRVEPHRRRGSGRASCPPGPRVRARRSTSAERGRTLSAGERATILAWARAGGRVDGAARGRKPAQPTPARPGESTLRPRDAGARTARARRRARPTTTAASCSTRSCPATRPSRRHGSSRGRRAVVHHVILFRVAKAQVADARSLDARAAGPGWGCFGGTGLPAGSSAGGIQDALNNANWIAAWAPGWGAGRLPEGTGVQLAAGSQVVMQVHYNLLQGRAPDRSQAILTTAPASAGLTPLQTMLLPGPVELACAPGERGKLCSRTEALFELSRKYGGNAALVPAGLLILCGRDASAPQPSATSTATGGSRRRRRSTSPPGTCTSSARRSRSS